MDAGSCSGPVGAAVLVASEFAMTFGVRKFLREIPVKTLRAYFESKSAPVPTEWWKHKEPKLISKLADYLISGTDQLGAGILAEMVRIHPMASERGRNALINAAYTVSRDPADVSAFKAAVCQFHRRRDGSGVSSEIEFAERHQDKSIQVAVYVQGLPNNGMEFVNGKHVRRISNPSLEAAVVYDPSNGNTSTVTKGGKEVHEALREAFARKLLKIEPKFDAVRKRRFLLDSLKTPQPLAPDPALGVKAVRVRKLKLAPPAMDSGLLSIEAPAGMLDTSVYDLGNRWFSERAGVYCKFTVVHATIAMHFNIPPGAKKAKTLNIELTRPNTSNLKDLPDADRKIAEAHIEKWKLIEPAE
jgi:hypothetical protein